MDLVYILAGMFCFAVLISMVLGHVNGTLIW
jgi:hypothetical protein